MYKHPQEIKVADIPKSFDLRNVSGVDYTGKIRDQGACGSCYGFAFVQAIESRIKTQTQVSKFPNLSPQQMI